MNEVEDYLRENGWTQKKPYSYWVNPKYENTIVEVYYDICIIKSLCSTNSLEGLRKILKEK